MKARSISIGTVRPKKKRWEWNYNEKQEIFSFLTESAVQLGLNFIFLFFCIPNCLWNNGFIEESEVFTEIDFRTKKRVRLNIEENFSLCSCAFFLCSSVSLFFCCCWQMIREILVVAFLLHKISLFIFFSFLFFAFVFSFHDLCFLFFSFFLSFSNYPIWRWGSEINNLFGSAVRMQSLWVVCTFERTYLT